MDEWVTVQLRTLPDTIPPASRFREVSGRVVGVRSGSVVVHVRETDVLFWPHQLERQVRPE
jgi:ribosomal protein L21E